MTPEAMSETMMNPDTRRLVEVTMADMGKAEEYFELFLGKTVKTRRDYIIENFDKYSEQGA